MRVRASGSRDAGDLGGGSFGSNAVGVCKLSHLTKFTFFIYNKVNLIKFSL